jgi:hypothetical protein
MKTTKFKFNLSTKHENMKRNHYTNAFFQILQDLETAKIPVSEQNFQIRVNLKKPLWTLLADSMIDDNNSFCIPQIAYKYLLYKARQKFKELR